MPNNTKMEHVMFGTITSYNGIGTMADLDAIFNLKRMASVMDRIQALLGAPLKITMGFVSPAKMCLDESIDNEHLEGRAARFECPAFGSPKKIATELKGHQFGFDLVRNDHHLWCTIIIPPVGIPAANVSRA